MVLSLRLRVAAIWQLLRDALQSLWASWIAGSALEAVPRDVVALDGAAAVASLCVVRGVATRSVPPADEVLSFFNYRLSPFYAELPAEALPAPSAEAGSSDSVRWLRLLDAREPSEFAIAMDEGRRSLLQQLYDEALATERSRRRGGGWVFPWSGGDEAK